MLTLDLQISEGVFGCLDGTDEVDVSDEELACSEGIRDQALREEEQMFGAYASSQFRNEALPCDN